MTMYFFSSRRRHTICSRDWSSDVCSSDLASPARSRKMPQWLFLGSVFRDVILRDRAGDAVAKGGVHVNLWRRGLLAAAAGIALLWLPGMPVSCFNTRRLAARTPVAAQGLAGPFASEAVVPCPGTPTH